MQALHFPFQLRQARRGGLDEQQMFARAFEFALPGIEGFDRAANDVDARGKALLHDDASNLPGKHKSRAGYEDDSGVFGSCARAFSLLLVLTHGGHNNNGFLGVARTAKIAPP